MNTVFRRLGLRLLALALAANLAAAPAIVRADPQIVAPTGTPITLDVSKGVILRLDRAASNVFVADPAIADIQLKSPTTLYLLGKAAGETTIFAVDQQDKVLINSRVSVHNDAEGLQRAINEMVPGNQVEVKPVRNSVMLQGSLSSAAQGDDINKIAASFVADKNHIINNMQLDAPNQVNLRVRIAEVSRDVIKQLGINWDVAVNAAAKDALTFSTAAPTGFAAGNLLSSTFKNGSTNVQATINALEQHDLLTVLAEPNLTAVSGQKASFLAGGEFPIPVPQASSGGSTPIITIDYKQFGVSLNFTPVILGHDRISLQVAPEVSQLSTQNSVQIDGFNIPSLTTRRAETTVELGSGQSFVIGGLLQNSTSQDLSKFPWLGDVPVLGALFRSTQFQRNESELVIIVTPYLVKPVSSKRIAAPTDGFIAPSDGDRVLRGALNRLQAEPYPTGSLATAMPAASPGAPMTPPAAPMPLAAVPASARMSGPVGPVGFEID